MSKRLIPKNVVKQAYSKDMNMVKLDLKLEDKEENKDLDLLPGEIFTILGELVSFIEIVNNFEEEENENK